MKKRTILIIFLIITGFHLYCQETKIDQINPVSKKPGKILKMKEMMRITDEQGGFYFRYPYGMRVSDEGEIFLMDYNQMMRFDKNGKLLNNYYKKGQGPGELVSIRNYVLNGEFIIVFNVRPHKILWFEKKGPLVKEFRIYKNFFSGDLIAYRNSKYYIVTNTIPVVKGNSGFTDDIHKLIEISADGEELKTLASYPVKTFTVMFEGGRASKGIARFISRVHKNRYLVLSHTPEYQIKIYDLERKCPVRVFSRKYKRIKPKSYSDDDIMLQGKRYDELKLKYVEDLEDLFLLESKILVITLTENKKGTLIDMFDYNGNYLDNCYLKLKGRLMAVWKDYIFVREQNKYGAAEIVKYFVRY
jgi:hypothetical protein